MLFKQTATEVMEVMRDSLQKDLALVDLKDFVDGDESEYKLIIKQAQVNYQMLLEIYHWLQSRS